jgi:ligand-binding sensor domain-containing protein
MRRLLLLCVLFSTGYTWAQNNTPIGTWRMHLPYNSVRQVIDAGEILYVLSDKGVYTFDLKSGAIEMLTKVDGFSESEVAAIAYSEAYECLVIAYNNTNIDLLKGNSIINIPAIERANIVGVKRINAITAYQQYVYFATTFGVVVLDLEREEIIDDYQNLGANGTILEIQEIALHQDTIYLASEEGLKYAPAFETSVNLKNFGSWTTRPATPNTTHVTSYRDGLFYVSDSILYRLSEGLSAEVEAGNKQDYRSLRVSQNQLVVVKREGIIALSNSGRKDYGNPFMDAATLDFQENLWFGGFYTGLIKLDPANNYSYANPQGPFGITVYEMQGEGTRLWVTSGGHTSSYGPTYNSFGYYVYEDGNWTNRRQDNAIVGDMLDMAPIAVNDKTGEVWMGSFASGLARLKNGEPQEKFDHTNSSIGLAPGDLPVCLGVTLDEDDDLWITNYETERALVVRRTDGSWEDFNVGQRRVGEIIADDYNSLWMTIPRNSSEGILVAQENDFGTMTTRTLRTGKGSGNLPNNTVNALALDKDGEIWVGTATGLAVFYNPSLVFEGGANADAQQIIIEEGDDIGYLLGSEVINDIKVDGANRKWVATNNGAWLVAEDGSEVIRHLTEDNSPLPCNQVICIGIVPLTGEVFFGTNCGIVSFRGDATEATQVHSNTLVYPNPVHPEYEGPITITGLPEDATVKIADVAGRVVYEMISNGGTAVWNGRNFNGEKPQTGVYLIFTANKDDEDTLVSKLLFVR